MFAIIIIIIIIISQQLCMDVMLQVNLKSHYLLTMYGYCLPVQ